MERERLVEKLLVASLTFKRPQHTFFLVKKNICGEGWRECSKAEKWEMRAQKVRAGFQLNPANGTAMPHS